MLFTTDRKKEQELLDTVLNNHPLWPEKKKITFGDIITFLIFILIPSGVFAFCIVCIKNSVTLRTYVEIVPCVLAIVILLPILYVCFNAFFHRTDEDKVKLTSPYSLFTNISLLLQEDSLILTFWLAKKDNYSRKYYYKHCNDNDKIIFGINKSDITAISFSDDGHLCHIEGKFNAYDYLNPSSDKSTDKPTVNLEKKSTVNLDKESSVSLEKEVEENNSENGIEESKITPFIDFPVAFSDPTAEAQILAWFYNT